MLYKAMLKIDAVLRKRLYRPSVEHAGSTAVVGLITPRDILVANTGDSRAVLCRAGRAVAMSEDHKPDTPSERRRIQRAGLMVANGRVNGELAVSRALGDYEYKGRSDLEAEAQAVTAAPDVRSLPRHPSDEFLVLACDGIWDVMSSEEGVGFAREACRSKGGVPKGVRQGPGQAGQQAQKGVALPAGTAAATPAAAPLARAASCMLDHCLELGSRDNMTLAIVQLGVGGRAPGQAAPGAGPSKAAPSRDSTSSSASDMDGGLRQGKGRPIAPSPLTLQDQGTGAAGPAAGASRGGSSAPRASARPRQRNGLPPRRAAARPRTQFGGGGSAASRYRAAAAARMGGTADGGGIAGQEPTWSFTPDGNQQHQHQRAGAAAFGREAESRLTRGR